MSYPFISFNSTVEQLKAHLREQCGIEKSGSKKELIDAILAFEAENGLVRSDKDGSETAAPVSNLELPLEKQRKVRIVIAESDQDRSDVYVSINDWDALIKRGVEVAVPEAVYVLLSEAGDQTFTQEKDGSLTEGFSPRYHVKLLGYQS